jgi:hypothetical protein
LIVMVHLLLMMIWSLDIYEIVMVGLPMLSDHDWMWHMPVVTEYLKTQNNVMMA